MPKPYDTTVRAAVKAKAIELGEFTRRSLIDAMAPMSEESAGQAADGLFRSDPEIRMTRRDSARFPDGSRRFVRVYAYLPSDAPHAWPKELPAVAANWAVKQRSRTAAQRAPSGYEPGHFTALIRGSSWAGLLTFCGKPFGPKPISMLQTIQRRESDSVTGKGWGSGTTIMPGTPMQARPRMMERAA